MTDTYLAIAAVANDQFMQERMIACVVQQAHLGNAPVVSGDHINTPLTMAATTWVQRNNYLWACSPSWGDKWAYALAAHPDEPDYEPGKDEAVITDGDILAAVQALTAMVSPE
jgi:hypothetical protein